LAFFRIYCACSKMTKLLFSLVWRRFARFRTPPGFLPKLPVFGKSIPSLYIHYILCKQFRQLEKWLFPSPGLLGCDIKKDQNVTISILSS